MFQSTAATGLHGDYWFNDSLTIGESVEVVPSFLGIGFSCIHSVVHLGIFNIWRMELQRQAFSYLVGGLKPVNFMTFPSYWECQHIPTDFHSMIFQRGRAQTTNQGCLTPCCAPKETLGNLQPQNMWRFQGLSTVTWIVLSITCCRTTHESWVTMVLYILYIPGFGMSR